MPAVSYPSDLTDPEWQLLAPLLPPAKPGGHPRTVNLRQILNGIFYVLRAGCAWRMLPRDYGPWSTVYDYFRTWRPRGMWVVPGMEIAPEVLALFERPREFRHLPRRWVIERTFAWIGRNRRMSKDYEYLPTTSEVWVYLSMLWVMLKRLAREQVVPAFHYRRVA